MKRMKGLDEEEAKHDRLILATIGILLFGAAITFALAAHGLSCLIRQLFHP